MKRIAIVILVFSIYTFSLAEYPFTVFGDDEQVGTDTINQKDEQGRKQGMWVYFGKDQPEKGFPEDGKISEGTFVDDRKEGRWIMYFTDGKTPKVEGDFSNNRPNGDFIKYYPNGKVMAEGTFSKRYYTNTLKRYNEDGILVYSSVQDTTGKEIGEVKYFYDNGNPEFVYTAKNGVPTGEAIRYWSNGDIKEKIVFGESGEVLETSGEIARVNPEVKIKTTKDKVTKLPPHPIKDENFKPNGYNKIFNSDKEIWQEGDFKNGLLYDGRLYIYDEDGLLYKVEVYKDGKYHSDGQL